MNITVLDRKVIRVNLLEHEIKNLIKERALKMLEEIGITCPVVEINVSMKQVLHPIDPSSIEASVEVIDFGPNDHQRIIKERNAGNIF